MQGIRQSARIRSSCTRPNKPATDWRHRAVQLVYRLAIEMIKTKQQAVKLGRLGKGKPKHFTDPQAAIEQRRQAGIKSGIARRKLSIERKHKTKV